MIKIFSFICAAFFTPLLLWAIGWLWFASTVAFANPPEEIETTQAIVVLTGGNGRVNAGLDLLAKDSAPKLFISGVNKGVTKDDIYASWKNPAKEKPCCIYLGYEAEDTIGNAIETREWLQKNEVKKITLVTSSYHMPRAKQELSKTLREEIEIIPYPVFSDDFEPWKGRFWSLTFSEYNKTVVRWLGLNNSEQG